jgi:nitrate reductase molybdenum cofactor assembly chaperone NarJ/NarW
VSLRRRPVDHRVVHLAAAWCLSYPDETMIATLPVIEAALDEQPHSELVTRLRSFVDRTKGHRLADLEREYVDVFDISRKHALYLSYWTDGDTRRRGEVLGRFKAAYRSSGFLVDTHGELPDYLPMVLEFAACADAEAGAALLQDYRASLELLRIALQEKESPYAAAVVAVCATLPGPSPVDRAAVMEMVGLGGPQPTESVGLDPYDPRLLPLQTVSRQSSGASS